ncbi:MAG: signal peptidase I [Candidatus Moranbacteria bacterium]|nr:signal peptidase I [Candidatus Moranbacteria bacterium]
MTTNPKQDDRSGKKSDPNVSGEDLGAGQFFLEMVRIFVLAAVIIIPVRVFLFQPFFVQGSSMVPNFHDGEYLVVNEFGYKRTDVGLTDHPIFSVKPFRKLVRQEPIVFRSPQKEDLYLIKRVIGLPGETVRIERGKVVISDDAHPDGWTLDESAYLASSVVTTDMKPVTLGPDQYLVLGDNRMNSLDSRIFGPIDGDLVIGEVLLRAWPITKAEWYR